MSDEKDLGGLLEDLANTIAADAAKEGVKLSDRLEAFKILSQHHVGLEKVKGKAKGNGDTPPGTTTMGGLKDRVNNGARNDEPTAGGEGTADSGDGSSGEDGE